MSLLQAAQIGLDIGQNLLSRSDQKKANRQNIKLAREQMAFQERMRDTQYQAAAKDLEKAGLNRILALGSPAASPQGATATVESQSKNAKHLEFLQLASAKEALEGQRQQNRILKSEADKAGVVKKPYEIVEPYLDKILDAVQGSVSSAKDLGESVSKGIDRLRDTNSSNSKDVKGKDWSSLSEEEKSEYRTKAMHYLRDKRRRNTNKRSPVEVLLPGIDY